VKTTSLASRVHHVGSLAQLDPSANGEEVFVFSVGLRSDPSTARKLPDFVADVESQCVDTAGTIDQVDLSMLRQQLQQYGYESEHEELYRTGPGFMKPHLPPAMFPEQELARLRSDSFVGGALPRDFIGVTYTLEIKGDPMSDHSAAEVFRRLLRSPTVSSQPS